MSGCAPALGVHTQACVGMCLKPGEVHPGPCKGRGGKIRRAAKAVARKRHPPHPAAPGAAPGAAPHPMVRGRDILSDLDMTTVGALSKRDDQGRDLQLAAIAAAQGFDGPPQVGAAADLDELRGQFGIEVFRGVSNGETLSGEQIAEQFRSGGIHYGQGISGNGIYTSNEFDQALGYTSSHDPDAVTRMIIHPDAQVVTLDDVRAMMADQMPPDTRERIKALGVYTRGELFVPGGRPQDTVSRARRAAKDTLQPQDWLWMDPSVFAMAKGIDVIKHPQNRHRDEYVILNRTAVMAQRPDRPPRTLAELYADEDEFAVAAGAGPGAGVSACMPPTVAVPKPGPCPGAKRESVSAIAKTVAKVRKAHKTGQGAAVPRTKATGKASQKASQKPGQPQAPDAPGAPGAPGPGTGRDLGQMLNRADIAALARRDEIGNDQRLAAIAAAQGFDAAARAASVQQMDAAVAAGGRNLFRGVKPRGGLQPAQIHESSLFGTAHFGQGIFGNGVYMSSSPTVAHGYSDFSTAPGAVRRVVLDPDARTISYPDLLTLMARDTTTSSQEYQAKAAELLADLAKARDPADWRIAWESYQGNPFEAQPQDLLRVNPGAWAMSRGYDAIVIPMEDLEEVIVLNRGALLAEPADVPTAELRGPATGRDLSGELNMRGIARMAHHDDTGADQRLAFVAAAQGFNVTPQAVDARSLDAAVAQGGKRLWRGVIGQQERTPRQINEQFTEGSARFGQGIFGNGVYFSNQPAVAARYANFSEDPDAVQSIVLPATARTISYPELLRRMGDDPSTADFDHARLRGKLLRDLASANGDPDVMRQAWERYQGTSLHSIPQSDPGLWAMSHGFDAIVVPMQDGTAEEVVLLNRGAALVEARSRTASAAAWATASAAVRGSRRVQACRPPHVPVPRPGPCPKKKFVSGMGTGVRRTANTIARKTVATRRSAHNARTPPGKKNIDRQLDYTTLALRPSGGTDRALAEIARRQGFDTLPQRRDPATLDAAVRAGGTEIWRGQVGYPGRSAAEATDQFLHGQADYPPGLWGSGFTATTDPTPLDTGGITAMRMVLPADADIVDLDDLTARRDADQRRRDARQRELWRAIDQAPGYRTRELAVRALQDWTARQPARDRIRSDPGRLGAILGHDAIRVRRPGQPDRYVLLNRGKLLVQQPPQPLSQTAAASTAVRACMPPKVAVPKPGPCKGNKRGLGNPTDTVQKTVKKAVKKTTATAAPKGRKKAGPASGRDLSHLLNLESIAELPRRSTTGSDARLAAIAKEQGFDRKATLADAATLDAAIGNGGKELWRAVKTNDARMKPQEIHDRSATGPVYFGRGLYGNGIYFANNAGLAAAYADEVYNPVASMRRSVLPADARTISYPDLLAQMARDTTTSSQAHQQRGAELLQRLARARDAADMRMAWESYQGSPYEASAQDLLRTDPGAWAMSRGYDAIIVPVDQADPDDPEDFDQQEIVVLNRGALLTERNPARARGRPGVSAGGRSPALVQGCMPPRSPVPKPGPCKGIKRGPGIRQKIRRAVGVGAPPGRSRTRRPEEVRTSLMMAETVAEVNEVAEAEARKITGRSIPFDLGGEDADIAREHAEGILQGLEKYPKARLRTVGTFDSRSPAWAGQGLDNAFAITNTGPYSSSILFNRSYIDDPARYRLVLSRQTGHLSVPSAIGIAWHEFGHVIGGDTLAATESKKIARSLAVDQGSKPSAFLKDHLSDYSTESRHELLAEAFADVMARGTEASAVSLAIVAEVDRRYEARQRPGGR